jgi:hypothetical protein
MRHRIGKGIFGAQYRVTHIASVMRHYPGEAVPFGLRSRSVQIGALTIVYADDVERRIRINRGGVNPSYKRQLMA